MTPPSKLSMQDQRTQAAQHDDPHPTPVCPSSSEGAMPLQSATLPHKKFPIPKAGPVAAPHDKARGQTPYAALHPQTVAWLDSVAKGAPAAHDGAASGGRAGSANFGLADIEGNAQRMPDCVMCGEPLSVEGACKTCVAIGANFEAQSKIPDWLESYEGIPAEVVNEAGIRGDDVPHVVLEKLEEQMKGKWAMVRFGQPAAMKMVSEPEKVSAEEEAHRWAASLRYPGLRINPNDFGFVLSWWLETKTVRSVLVDVTTGDRALKRAGLTAYVGEDEELARAAAVEMHLEHGQAFLEGKPPEEMVNVRGEQRSVDEYCVATPVPCTVPSREEALAMREMVEKAALAMRGSASMPERSYLSLPRQHDSPLSARVVPAGEAPDPKVGW